VARNLYKKYSEIVFEEINIFKIILMNQQKKPGGKFVLNKVGVVQIETKL
jgi:hypothetical protein